MDLSKIVHGMKSKDQRALEKEGNQQHSSMRISSRSESSDTSLPLRSRTTLNSSRNFGSSSSTPGSSGCFGSSTRSDSVSLTPAPQPLGSATEKSIKCNQCTRSFSSNEEYQRHLAVFHVRSKTPARPREANFSCAYCGKKFTSPSKRTLHVNATHLGMKPYQCNICSKSFGYKGDLKKHMSSHSGDKPYTCYVCGASFARNFYVKRHIENVHEKK